MIKKCEYEELFNTEKGKAVLNDILTRLGYGEPLGRVDQCAETKAVALYDFAVELKQLVDKQEKKDEL